MPRLKRVQIEYERKAEELREKFLDQLQAKGLQLNEPCELNLNSPKQMLSVFTETIGEEPVDEDGKPTVAKTVLENYTLDHPEVTAYLTWKRSKKRASMIGTIKKEAETEAPYKDVTRCSYRQLGAMTGRMSAVQPNLQQVAA